MKRKIRIYGKENCQYCTKAKAILDRYGWEYTYYIVGVDYTKEHLQSLVDVNPLTVPQIFINDQHIGGYVELVDYMENRINPTEA